MSERRFTPDAGAMCDTPTIRPVWRGVVAMQWAPDASEQDVAHLVNVARRLAASCGVDVLLVSPGTTWQELPAVELAREALAAVEWASTELGAGICPTCAEPEVAGKHAAGCLLDEALTRLGLSTTEKREQARAARRPS